MSNPIAPKPKFVVDGRFTTPILVDTREQLPFEFKNFNCDKSDGGGPLTVTTVRTTLPSGDYSLPGYELAVAIERKSMSDLYGTLGRGRERFERELERLKGYAFTAVVIEASWNEILNDPPFRTNLSPKTVFRSVLAYSVRYPRIHWFTADSRRLAEAITLRLLERFLKERLDQSDLTFNSVKGS
jgi:ERCC4-type nuclease